MSATANLPQPRYAWTVVQVRAQDLRPNDIARFPGDTGWHLVYDVYQCNEPSADMPTAVLALAEAHNDACVVVRFAEDYQSHPTEFDDRCRTFVGYDLVSIQHRDGSV